MRRLFSRTHRSGKPLTQGSNVNRFLLSLNKLSFDLDWKLRTGRALNLCNDFKIVCVEESDLKRAANKVPGPGSGLYSEEQSQRILYPLGQDEAGVRTINPGGDGGLGTKDCCLRQHRRVKQRWKSMLKGLRGWKLIQGVW